MAGSIEKTLIKIPSMTLRDTARTWQNAIDILGDKKKRQQHPDARIVLNAIGKEWEKRWHRPMNPEEMFAWPSTKADGGNGQIKTDNWIEEGVLKFVGYQVGSMHGKSQAVRETLLAELFRGSIPPAFPRAYLDEWGRPSSVARLRKMAETIAALARNAKRRRDSKLRAAIRDWEADLEYLYYEYYVGKFHFAWPATAI